MGTPPEVAKREAFRQRLGLTLELLAERKEYNPTLDPNFGENNYPTPLYSPNVAVQCAPVRLSDVQDRWVQGASLDDMMVEFYDQGGQPTPSYQFAKFVPYELDDTRPPTPPTQKDEEEAKK